MLPLSRHRPRRKVMAEHRFGYPADLLAQFPDLVAGAAFALGIDNRSEERAAEALVRAQEEVVKALFTSQPLSGHPHISAWRSAFSSFGVKPTQYRSAVEALLRHVLKKGSVPNINKLVDICNYVSMKHVLPVAAYDLDHVSGPVVVRFSKGDEPFLPLYAKETEYPNPGEVIYTDDEGALSRRWTWRQADRAKSTPQTRNALLTVEGVNGITGAAVEAAIEELVSLVSEYCGGEISCSMLDHHHPWAVAE
jgi:DNA/RNA-binding domain of Phe-tRNA-synthetase-like protein